MKKILLSVFFVLFISGNAFAIRLGDSTVNGDMTVNQNLYAISDILLNANISIEGNLSVTNALFSDSRISGSYTDIDDTVSGSTWELALRDTFIFGWCTDGSTKTSYHIHICDDGLGLFDSTTRTMATTRAATGGNEESYGCAIVQKGNYWGWNTAGAASYDYVYVYRLEL